MCAVHIKLFTLPSRHFSLQRGKNSSAHSSPHPHFPHPYYFGLKKRLFDVLVAGGVLIISLPIWIFVSVGIVLDSGWPIFFRQKRFGRAKQVFWMWKFRTMRPNAEHGVSRLQSRNQAPLPMFKIVDDPRFTRFGRWLSRTGIDELPQLINILKGEMSWVGPRPLPVDQARLLPKSWEFRYAVRPGLLSLWAIDPERYTSLRAWRKLELQTLQQGGLIFDLHLLWQTAVFLWCHQR